MFQPSAVNGPDTVPEPLERCLVILREPGCDTLTECFADWSEDVGEFMFDDALLLPTDYIICAWVSIDRIFDQIRDDG